VDWRAVITACHAATRYERRMANFCLRSAFHDAMSIDPECAKVKKPDDPGYDCGGAGEVYEARNQHDCSNVLHVSSKLVSQAWCCSSSSGWPAR
jgi:hypothetical protein